MTSTSVTADPSAPAGTRRRRSLAVLAGATLLLLLAASLWWEGLEPRDRLTSEQAAALLRYAENSAEHPDPSGEAQRGCSVQVHGAERGGSTTRAWVSVTCVSAVPDCEAYTASTVLVAATLRGEEVTGWQRMRDGSRFTGDVERRVPPALHDDVYDGQSSGAGLTEAGPRAGCPQVRG